MRVNLYWELSGTKNSISVCAAEKSTNTLTGYRRSGSYALWNSHSILNSTTIHVEWKPATSLRCLQYE